MENKRICKDCGCAVYSGYCYCHQDEQAILNNRQKVQDSLYDKPHVKFAKASRKEEAFAEEDSL